MHDIVSCAGPDLDSNSSPKCSHRNFVSMGKPHTALASVFLTKLVVAVLEALREQEVLDGATNKEEMDFAGPEPEEGDVQWTNPVVLAAGHAEKIEHMRKHGVYAEANEAECREHQSRPCTLKWVDKLKDNGCCSTLVVREIKRAQTKDSQLGAGEVFSAMPGTQDDDQLCDDRWQEFP